MLMKMEMLGICGIDKYVYEGKLIFYVGMEVEILIKYLFILGYENVGIVVEIFSFVCKGLEWNGCELKEGDWVIMCCDLVCGICWYCWNIYVYFWCKEVKIYGLSFFSIEFLYFMGGWVEYMVIKFGIGVYKVFNGIFLEVGVFNEIMLVIFVFD